MLSTAYTMIVSSSLRRIHLLTFAAVAAFSAFAASAPGLSGRSKTLVDRGWSFEYTPDSLSELRPFTETVDLPHDWSVSLPFDRKAPAGNDGAYLPTGIGRYTKSFVFSESDLRDSRHALLLEGVYERATVVVNGDTLAFRPYGYTSFEVDLTPVLVPGKNIVEVTADNSHQKNSRWYTGSGLYRHVYLLKTAPAHIDEGSLFVTTPIVSADSATVNVSFDVAGRDKRTIDAVVSVSDAAGKNVAGKSLRLDTDAAEICLAVAQPRLWSPESPELYTMTVTLEEDGKAIDEVSVPFGIRTVSYSATDGFRLNGNPVLLNGACVHHDNGILGAASYDAAEARKVRLLKEAGFNAVRTSHNPPAPAFLDECDRQGLLVIDEAFDGWRDSKNPNDYSVWFDRWAVDDVAHMVRRDRNHPSVIAWSIGNEIIERKKIEVISTARMLASECRRLDPTRPVTEALCAWDSDWEIYDPHAEVLDIVGYNYMIHKSESDHDRCPDRVMWQTESYPADVVSNWHKVSGNPYIIGDFVWTGIDYLGESGIGRFHYRGQTEGEHYERDQWPWHGAYCGDVDITGWRKPVSHLRSMLYNEAPEPVYMSVREPDGYHGEVMVTKWGVWPAWESWNWPGHEGKPIQVEVLSRSPRVALYLNDMLVGTQPAGVDNDCRAVFTLPYKPGVLRAAAIDSLGAEVAETRLVTAGEPAALRLTPDRTTISADGSDLAYVIIEVIDKDGNIVPDAALPVDLSVSGAGSLLASGSADLTSFEQYSQPRVTTWRGRALAILKSSPHPGSLRLSASAPGVRKSAVKIATR